MTITRLQLLFFACWHIHVFILSWAFLQFPCGCIALQRRAYCQLYLYKLIVSPFKPVCLTGVAYRDLDDCYIIECIQGKSVASLSLLIEAFIFKMNIVGVCRSTLDVGFDYPGNDIFPYLYNVSSAEQCCASCSANPACKTFSYITGDHFPNSQFPLRTCVLKSAISQRIPDPTVTTGIILPEKGAPASAKPHNVFNFCMPFWVLIIICHIVAKKCCSPIHSH